MKGLKRKLLNQLASYAPILMTHLLYRNRFGKNLNLKKPVTLNEKIQYMKIYKYKKNDLVTKCADKYAVRDYLHEKECGEILNELYFSCDHVDEINWDILPDRFVIKCNHGAGYNLICKDKSKLDINWAKKEINSWMQSEFWKINVEYNYKDIKKKIICEKYIDVPNGGSPDDYKIYCFHGHPHCVMLCVGRDMGTPKFLYFDRNFNLLKYSQDALDLTPEEIACFKKPAGYELLFDYAQKLSEPFDFVRVDFYLSSGKVIFGELTFTPSAGLDNERLLSTDIALGNLLRLQ